MWRAWRDSLLWYISDKEYGNNYNKSSLDDWCLSCHWQQTVQHVCKSPVLSYKFWLPKELLEWYAPTNLCINIPLHHVIKMLHVILVFVPVHELLQCINVTVLNVVFDNVHNQCPKLYVWRTVLLLHPKCEIDISGS